MALPPVPKACLEIITCGCKTKCSTFRCTGTLIVLQHVTVLGNAVIITKIIFHFFISINECTADLYNYMYDFEML